MEDRKARVVNERDELSNKIDELCDFLDSTTVFDKTLILKAQLAVMVSYLTILSIRIESWEENEAIPLHDR